MQVCITYTPDIKHFLENFSEEGEDRQDADGADGEPFDGAEGGGLVVIVMINTLQKHDNAFLRDVIVNNSIFSVHATGIAISFRVSQPLHLANAGGRIFANFHQQCIHSLL
jgi:hypothetical protein